MSIADHFLHRSEGEDLQRGSSGLAYSDREIALLKAWFDDCEEKARGLIVSLAECMTTATQALQPIGHSIDKATSEYEKRIRNLQNAISRVAKLEPFKKAPFFDRHFIPYGGMPDGIRTRDFDEHRNDESIFDEQFAKALKAQKEKEAKEKKRREIESRAAEEKREAEEDQRLMRRVTNEFLRELPEKARSAFAKKLEDSEFNKAFAATIQSTGALVAAVAINDGERIVEYRKILTTQLTARPDLLAVARVYLENSEEPIRMMQSNRDLGIPASRIPQGVAACEKILLELDAAVEKKAKKSSPASTAKPSKDKVPAKTAKPSKSTSKRG